MVQEEFQYQFNGADKYYISEIDIILNYCKYINGTLVVKFTGLHVLGNYSIKMEYVNIDYPDTLALYIIGSSIGVKSSKKYCFSVEANRWCKWDEKFANYKTRRIARLVRVIAIDYPEEAFGYQVTLDMMWPLIFQRLLLARPKKPGRKDRRRPNNGNLKYGIRVPRNVNKADHLIRGTETTSGKTRH